MTGLGNAALFIDTDGSLHVLAGRSYLTIEVAATPTSEIRLLAEQLAGSAVRRLREDERAD